jgi:hypothetical protein
VTTLSARAIRVMRGVLVVLVAMVPASAAMAAANAGDARMNLVCMTASCCLPTAEACDGSDGCVGFGQEFGLLTEPQTQIDLAYTIWGVVASVYTHPPLLLNIATVFVATVARPFVRV